MTYELTEHDAHGILMAFALERGERGFREEEFVEVADRCRNILSGDDAEQSRLVCLAIDGGIGLDLVPDGMIFV